MNKKFSHEEGLTLIELLITLAVIAIVFAIAVPVFSNVLAGAQTSADSAQAAALASFHDEYATTTLAFANGKTTATLNGVVIASIKGDATGGSAPVAPATVTFTSADFGSGSCSWAAPWSGQISFWCAPANMVTALGNLKAGDTITGTYVTWPNGVGGESFSFTVASVSGTSITPVEPLLGSSREIASITF